MKKLHLIFFLLFAVTLFSCSSDDGDNEDYWVSDNSKLSEVIRLKAIPDKDNKVSFNVTAEFALVNWGDGETSKATSGIQIHQYKDRVSRTIVIKANSLSSFSKDAVSLGGVSGVEFENLPKLKTIQCESLGLTSFKYTKIPLVEYILLTDNKLTSLDVSGLSRLRQIDISYNNFTKETVNSLFSTLPVSTEAANNAPAISIDTNITGYDLSLAQKRGWEVLFVSKSSEESSLMVDPKR